jgi:SWI/SNF-related matrix-associated actin-dependent regulator of chromatin subfamily A3
VLNLLSVNCIDFSSRLLGHLPKTVAAKLAPFMDRRELIVEAIISGEKGYYECPVALKMYGSNDPNMREQLMARLRAVKFPVTGAMATVREEQMKQKAAEQVARQAAKDLMQKKKGGAVVGVGQAQQYTTGMAEFAGGSSQGIGLGPSLDDIIGGSERFNPRNAEQFVEDFGIKESDLVSLLGMPVKSLLITIYRLQCPKPLSLKHL